MRPRLSVQRRQTLRGYLLAAPLLIVLACAVVLPALYNVTLAFFRYDAMRDTWRFAGLSNFTRLLSATEFWNAMWVTGLWLAGNVALQLAIGMMVALALNSVARLRALFNAIVMVPWVSSFVIVGVLFLWLYHPQLGVLNDVLLRLGLVHHPVGWLASPVMAQISLVLANSWKFFPLVTITLFTGLQALSRELTEAAAIDGATRRQIFLLVVVPLLAPSIATAVLLSTIWAFNAFTLPMIMTSGGPLRATEVIGFYIYKVAFDAFDFGAAAAAALLLFALILAITVAYLRVADPVHRKG
jgi:multiple sugar transport system permease protein